MSEEVRAQALLPGCLPSFRFNSPRAMKSTKRKRDAAPAKRSAESPSTAQSVTSRRYILSASCTVRESIDLRTALLELCDEPEAVVLDLASIERIDTAAMQVICAFIRDRRKAGRVVELSGEPEAFREAAQLLGLQHALAPSQVSGAAA